MEPKPVLVIEDDLSTQDLLGIYLENLGIEKSSLLFAASFQEARDKLQKAKEVKELPQIIFLNLVLSPTEYGLQLLKELKEENSPYKEIPIFIISGDSYPDIEKVCLNAGADGFIPKSFDLEKIKNALLSIQKKEEI